jgi:hypothetical protein
MLFPGDILWHFFLPSLKRGQPKPSPVLMFPVLLFLPGRKAHQNTLVNADLKKDSQTMDE